MKKHKQDEITKSRSYFQPEHEKGFHPVSGINWTRRGTGKAVYATYRILGDKQDFRTPRCLTSWLDERDDEFVDAELEVWKERVSGGFGNDTDFSPPLFLGHKRRFLKWCALSAQASTIGNYDLLLRRHVFPFFCRKPSSDNYASWPKHFDDWREWMTRRGCEVATRNQCRSALRRWLKYLFSKGLIPRIDLPLNENLRRGTKEGGVIPGQVPEWKDVQSWLKKLPNCREKYVILCMAAFGVRISEAIDLSLDRLVGEGDESKELMRTNAALQRCRNQFQASIFALVETAAKEESKRRLAMERIVGEQDDEPKTGSYIAVCFSYELADIFIDIVSEPERFDVGPVRHDKVARFITKHVSADPRYPFHEYRPHDFRRLSITLKALGTTDVGLTALIHGQASEEMVRRYFQWGKVMTRRASPETRRAFKPMARA